MGNEIFLFDKEDRKELCVIEKIKAKYDAMCITIYKVIDLNNPIESTNKIMLFNTKYVYEELNNDGSIQYCHFVGPKSIIENYKFAKSLLE